MALIDDDVRLAPDFLERIVDVLEDEHYAHVGCIAGCVARPPRDTSRRLRWTIQRLAGGITTTRPGAFDERSGHPIPRSLRDPGPTLRPVDVVGGGCAVWRSEVFDDGLRFASFFRTFSYGEDFHLALRAVRSWTILDYGRARFTHLETAAGRPAPFNQVAHRVINTRFTFVDIVPERTMEQEFRFWLFEAVDLVARIALAVCCGKAEQWQEVAGHWSGIRRAYRRWPGRHASVSPADRSDNL